MLCSSQEPARRAECRAYLAESSLLGSPWGHVGQTGVTPPPTVAMARGRPTSQVHVPRLLRLGSGPLCHLGPVCLQVQLARKSLQTLPRGFCVCTQSVCQPGPVGGGGVVERGWGEGEAPRGRGTEGKGDLRGG